MGDCMACENEFKCIDRHILGDKTIIFKDTDYTDYTYTTTCIFVLFIIQFFGEDSESRENWRVALRKELSMPLETKFFGWRKIFLPIHNFEIKKCLPMSLLLCCIILIYTLLRNLKDTLMVSKAICGGAEILGFLKLYGVTPAALLATILFVKLANILEREKLFYTIVGSFLSFFAIFGFVLYPLHDVLHFSEDTILSLQSAYPRLYWIFPIIGNWSFSLFYILTELWGNVVLCALFWQFANELTNVKESKRFYPAFIMIGQTGQLFAGIAIMFCANFAQRLGASGKNSGLDVFGTNLMYQIIFVSVVGVIAIGIYRWINRNVLTDSRLYTPRPQTEKNKLKLGIVESFKYMAKSSYLIMLVVMVLAYGISINLVEAVLKGQLKELCPDTNDYNIWMGNLSILTGVISVTLAIVANNLLQKFSWKRMALITPAILLVTSLLFYGLIIYKNNVGTEFHVMGHSILFLVVIVGFIQNGLTEGAKYALFDTIKQMAYIPLDPELRVKGQAAVEILAERSGKSGGAFIQSTLLLVAGGGIKLSDLSGILGTIIMIVVLVWIMAVLGLSKQFEKLTIQKGKGE